MTEREKQIIEMAGDMSFASTKVDLYLDDRKEIAKVLYLLGYRKVDDGAVVLTQEELEDMVKAKIKCMFDMAVIARKKTAKEFIFKVESYLAYHDDNDTFTKKKNY